MCHAFPSLSVYVPIVFLQPVTRVAFRQPRPSDGLAKWRRGSPSTSPLLSRTLARSPFSFLVAPRGMSSYPHRHAQTNTLPTLPPLFLDTYPPVCLFFFFPEKKEAPHLQQPAFFSCGYLYTVLSDGSEFSQSVWLCVPVFGCGRLSGPRR